MNVLELFKPITTFVFDVDGVLTDGSVLVMPNAVMVRRMNIKDGYALQLAIKKSYRVLIISGGESVEVRERLNRLGVFDVFMKVSDKAAVLHQYMIQHQIQHENILYMGDDIPDVPVMKLVGLPCCPQDAAPEVKAISEYISHVNGGCGAARDIIEQVMKVKGLWMRDFDAQND